MTGSGAARRVLVCVMTPALAAWLDFPPEAGHLR